MSTPWTTQEGPLIENPREENLEHAFSVVAPKHSSAALYSPLSTVSHQIRILNVSLDDKGRLYGILEVVSLTETDDYVAISSMWGDPDDTKAIRIMSNGIDDLPFHTTSNLYKGLEHLYRLRYRRVWADAICINQHDVEERNLQVRNMRFIYSKATKVVACIGEVSQSEGKEANNIFGRLSSYDASLVEAGQSWVMPFSMARDFEQMNMQRRKSEAQKKVPVAPLSDRDIAVLLSFFRKPYWKRVWILQEISVAKDDIVLLYGGTQLSWNSVIMVIQEWDRLRLPNDSHHIFYLMLHKW